MPTGEMLIAVTKTDAGRHCPAPNCVLGFGVAARYVFFSVSGESLVCLRPRGDQGRTSEATCEVSQGRWHVQTKCALSLLKFSCQTARIQRGMVRPLPTRHR